jgi:integrase
MSFGGGGDPLLPAFSPVAFQPHEERSRERVLQSDEFERFFATLNTEEETFRDFVLLTLLTGARKSNVFSMQWEHLNLNKVITYPSGIVISISDSLRFLGIFLFLQAPLRRSICSNQVLTRTRAAINL